MKRAKLSGVSVVEFAFTMLVMCPLFLGTGVTGINMIRTLQTIQLARDSGHMYANPMKDIDWSVPANVAIIGNLGSSLGLSTTPGQGSAEVILSKLTYIDAAACVGAGAADKNGVPTSKCANYKSWAFLQRFVIGNPNVHPSDFDSVSGLAGVTISPSTGDIQQTEAATNPAAKSTFTGINPDGTAGGDLPSGQVLYLAEAAGPGFSLPPFSKLNSTYSWAFF